MIQNRKRVFMILWLGSILGGISIVPYQLAMINAPLTWSVIRFVVLQSAVLFGVIVWLGILIYDKVSSTFGFKFLFLDGIGRCSIKNDFLFPGLMSGLFIGISIFCLDFLFFKSSVVFATNKNIPVLYRFISFLYGMINEEVFLRLFILPLFIWMVKKYYDHNTVAWSGIITSAVVFGVLHLPVVSRGMPLTFIVVIQVLILNGIAGVILGWLFWKKGFETAMLAHGTADIVIHGIIPLLF